MQEMPISDAVNGTLEPNAAIISPHTASIQIAAPSPGIVSGMRKQFVSAVVRYHRARSGGDNRQRTNGLERNILLIYLFSVAVQLRQNRP